MEYHITVHTDIYRKYLVHKMDGHWDILVFRTASADLANEVLAFLNSRAPSNLLNYVTCEHGYPTIPGPNFEIKEVTAATTIVSSIYPFKKSEVDFESYPYNYLFLEGHTDRKDTLDAAQAFVNIYFTELREFIDEMRTKFGPTIV